MSVRALPWAPDLVALLAWSAFLAVALDRPELFAVTAAFAVALLWPGEPPRDFEVTRELSARRLYEGQCVTVRVTLAAAADCPLLLVRERLPPLACVTEGHAKVAVAVRAGETMRWRYTLCLPARGHYRLAPPAVWSVGRGGLLARRGGGGEGAALRVYPRPIRLGRLPAPARTRSAFGNYTSAAQGQGLEPAEVRLHVPGDPLRRVNWVASLRRTKLHVTDFHAERNSDVMLVLDATADLGARPGSCLDLCASAAAATAAAYLARRDRVGLIRFGGYVDWVAPAYGARQHERLLEALLAAEVRFSYVRRGLHELPPRVLSPQALVLAFSALLDERFLQAMVELAARRRDLLLVALSPLALLRASLEPSRIDALALRLWALEWQARRTQLRRHGVTVADWDPAQSIASVLARQRQRMPRRPVA